MFRPASVAVVGASADPAKWGHWLALGALRGERQRDVHLVNVRGGQLAGHEVHRSLRDLPVVPELVAVCVPAPAVDGVVNEALALGVRAFVVITSGFPDGAEAALGERVRRAGARLVGPSCLGLFDADADLALLWGSCVPGVLGIVSQSGQVGLEVAGLAAEAGLGVSRFVSVGTEADVTAAELLADLAGHRRTRAVVVYLEGFRHGRALVAAMARLWAAGVPVVVLTAGTSAVGAAAVRSHTGALGSALEIVRAACRAGGAVLAESPAEAVRVAGQLVGRLPGRGGAGSGPNGAGGWARPEAGGSSSGAGADQLPGGVPGDGEACGSQTTGTPGGAGGSGAVWPDGLPGGTTVECAPRGERPDEVRAEGTWAGGAPGGWPRGARASAAWAGGMRTGVPCGDRVGVVSDSGGQGALAVDLPSRAGLRPVAPVDLAGAGESDLGVYAREVRRLAESGVVDAVVLTGYFGRYALDTPGIAAQETAVAREITRVPVPVLVHSMGAGQVGAVALAEFARCGTTVHADIGAVVGALRLAVAWAGGAARDTTAGVRDQSSGGAGELNSYWSARGLLAGIGVPYPVARLVGSREEALAAARELRGPVVLKADWVAHRTEVRGVALGLSDAAAVRAAYDDMAGRLGEHGFVLEEMDRREDVVELIVGFRQYPGFGAVVLVGMGGTLAEVYRDTAVELAPVDEELSTGMLRRLRGWPLLDGWRGRAPVDVAGVARVVVALSRLAVARPGLAEVEVNPLRVGPDGVVAVDALVVR